jgi:homoserine dehydrogenase
LADLEGAAALGLTIRLLATATRGDDGATVVPTAVPADGPFGRTGGVTNRVELDGEPIGSVGLSGPGAGGGATSSAVLGDLVAIARGLGSTWAGLPAATDPAIPAGDAFTAPRAWFTVLPGVTQEAAGRVAGVRVAATHDGVAIVTAVQGLEAARSVIAGLLPGGAGTPPDATLYPVDD